MDYDNLTSTLRHFKPREPATAQVLDRLEDLIGRKLPDSYRRLMRRSNGLEGFLPNDMYIFLWPAEEIATLNDGYRVSDFAPGLLLFGSDGGGTAYAFDTRGNAMSICDVPFIGMSLADITPICATFDDFIPTLSS